MSTRYQFVDDSGETRLAGTLVPDPGVSSSAVGCVLARDADFNIRLDAPDGSVLWDALYDNLWDLDPLAAIPDGLGLTFAFDGSSSLIVPTEAGVWSLSYSAVRGVDNGWAGSFAIGGVGLNLPWVQNRNGGTGVGVPYMAGALTTPLPAGTQLTHDVATTNEASADPYVCTQVYLSIVRLA